MATCFLFLEQQTNFLGNNPIKNAKMLSEIEKAVNLTESDWKSRETKKLSIVL